MVNMRIKLDAWELGTAVNQNACGDISIHKETQLSSKYYHP